MAFTRKIQLIMAVSVSTLAFTSLSRAAASEASGNWHQVVLTGTEASVLNDLLVGPGVEITPSADGKVKRSYVSCYAGLKNDYSGIDISECNFSTETDSQSIASGDTREALWQALPFKGSDTGRIALSTKKVAWVTCIEDKSTSVGIKCHLDNPYYVDLSK